MADSTAKYITSNLSLAVIVLPITVNVLPDTVKSTPGVNCSPLNQAKVYVLFNVLNLNLNMFDTLPSNTSLLNFIPKALLKVVTFNTSPSENEYPSVVI